MRPVVFVASALFLIGCGPDPNAQLPGLVMPSKTGGASGSGGIGSGGIVSGTGGAAQGGGGVVGTGGAPAKGGSGGGNPFVGGTTGSTGGIVVVGSGGVVGTGGVVGSGGVSSDGGVLGSGGIVGTGGGMDIDGGGSEPCVPAKTITGSGSGNSGSFGTTGAFCFRTADAINGWDCSNFTGRTLKVNSVTTTCGAKTLPAKVNGYYYFDASAGGVDYASIYWY